MFSVRLELIGKHKFGFLRSLKPLLVKDLAIKIINESLTNKNEGVTIYKSMHLFN